MLNDIFRENRHSVTKDNPQLPSQPGDPDVPAGKYIPCDTAGCSQHAVSRIDFHFFCVSHLVSHCYDRLEEFEHAGNVHRAPNQDSSGSGFLQDCAAKIASLLITHTGLANLERARLLDILLWANELDRKRRDTQFPV